MSPLFESPAIEPPGWLTIANQVKGARFALGITQRQLAEKCGIAQKQIAHAELGYDLTLKTLQQIADGLHKAGHLLRLEIRAGAELPRKKPWNKRGAAK